jgi:predicted RNA polymerase sigma factor
VISTDSHRAIEAVFRIEHAKLIAGLARMLRDVGLAELAQDALVAALEKWWPQAAFGGKADIPDAHGNVR